MSQWTSQLLSLVIALVAIVLISLVFMHQERLMKEHPLKPEGSFSPMYDPRWDL